MLKFNVFFYHYIPVELLKNLKDGTGYVKNLMKPKILN